MAPSLPPCSPPASCQTQVLASSALTHPLQAKSGQPGSIQMAAASGEISKVKGLAID